MKKYADIKIKRPNNLARIAKLREEVRNRTHIAFKNGFLSVFILFKGYGVPCFARNFLYLIQIKKGIVSIAE